jgi:predicted acyl esterase
MEMAKIRAALALCLAGCSSLAAESIFPEAAAFTGSEIRIPLRDGKMLAADLILPKAGGKYPVILIQTPYNKKNVRASFTGGGRFGADSLFTDTHYAFVVTDWRGKFGSIAALEPGAAADLGKDGFDVCAWIAGQEWSNGKIGTWGPSALGKVQYETARAHPPNLVCAAPSVMPLNITFETYYPGGALWDEWVTMLVRLGFGAQLYKQITSNPLKNGNWDTIAKTYVKGEDMRIPMLLVGGWYDVYPDTVPQAFETIRKSGGESARLHSKLVMGPWTHAIEDVKIGALEFPAAHWYGMQKTRAFMDYWLRGVANDFDKKEPSIIYYQMGDDRWRSTKVWPPKNVTPRSYYLQPNRSLSTNAPTAGAGAIDIRFDPANPVPTVGGHVLDAALHPGPQDQREKVESRDDVVVFSTAALSKAVSVAGQVTAKFFVSSDKPDTDFTAILTDVYPDGRSMLVTEGIQRMRFRNTSSKEEFLEPGTTYPVTVDLTNTALTFPAGHRIRLIVSSSNYPRYAVNFNDGGPMYEKKTGQVANNKIFCDKQHASALILPAALMLPAQ